MVLDISPNGNLRLRKMKNGKGVVELRGYDGTWVWCVWKSRPMDCAKELFANQVRWHQV